MDSRKTVLIATICAIALLAVGIGYAYTAYTANNGNTSDTSYATITQIGDNPYNFTGDKVDVKLDTLTVEEDNQVNTYYRLHEGVELSTASLGSYLCKDLGTIQFHAEMTGTNTNPDLHLEVSYSNFPITGHWVYIIGSAPVNNEITVYSYMDSTGIKDGDTVLTMIHDGEDYNEPIVHVYYGYSTTDEIEKYGVKYVNNITQPAVLNNSTIVFKATSETVIHTITCNANNDTQEKLIIQTIRNTFSMTSVTETHFTTPEDKQFKEWNTQQDGQGATVTSPLNMDGNKTVWAIWEDTQ